MRGTQWTHSYRASHFTHLVYANARRFGCWLTSKGLFITVLEFPSVMTAALPWKNMSPPLPPCEVSKEIFSSLVIGKHPKQVYHRVLPYRMLVQISQWVIFTTATLLHFSYHHGTISHHGMIFYPRCVEHMLRRYELCERDIHMLHATTEISV